MTTQRQSPILFQEPNSSGRSLKNWVTRYGGASGCLSVMVTEEEILLRSNLLAVPGVFPFLPKKFLHEFQRRLDEQGDLSHCIPQKDILSMTVKPRWWGAKTFLIEYKDAAGVIKRVELNPKKHAEFERALRIPREVT